MYYLKGQKHFDDCGTACVATILGLYGKHTNYKNINKANTFLDILVILKSYNINCKAVENDVITNYPCIVQTRFLKHYHFIVIYAEINNKFLYFSPNKLFIHKISQKRFYRHYTNKCINIYEEKPYHKYKICLNSIPFSVKIILLDIILIILIISLLNSMFFML